MNIRQALARAAIDRRDADILLSHLLQRSRAWLLAHDDDVLSEQDLAAFTGMIERRGAGEPVAYITGTKEFFGRTFCVDPSVLIPRPATEEVVSYALRALQGEDVNGVHPIDAGIVAWIDVWGPTNDIRLLADIGTGSGCIGITLACELPNLRVIATDVSTAALEIARENAGMHGVEERITWRTGSCLEPLADSTDPFLLVSNPPYIPAATPLQRDVADFEPHAALFAGPDGTDILHAIVTQAKAHPACRGFVVECRAEQVNPPIPPPT